MKKLILFLLTALAAFRVSAQSSSTSPGTGHWVVILGVGVTIVERLPKKKNQTTNK